jgi:hypothetical protein
MKRKRLFILLTLLCVLFAGWEISYRLYYDFKKYDEFQSPSGEYILTVYVASRFDPVSEYLIPFFSSQSPYKSAYVTLKNKDGKSIKNPIFLFCSHMVTIGEIEIIWDKRPNCIYYTKIDYIRLK